MAITYLLPNEGNFYKANLHCHTTLSDGHWTPEEVKANYLAHGYSIVAYTDHNQYIYHQHLASEDFLPLAGYEADNNASPEEYGYKITNHLCAIAIDPYKAKYVDRPNVYDVDALNKMIAEMRENGFIVNLNHPSWSGEDAGTIAKLEGLFGLETYNHLCEETAALGYGHMHYDVMLKKGHRLFALATDDTHNPTHIQDTPEHPSVEVGCFGGFVMIKAKELSYKEVIRALQAGEFYSTNGPLIHNYYIKDDMLCIDCDPVSQILMKGIFPGGVGSKRSTQDTLTHAEFPLEALRQKKQPFVRIELWRKDGKMAWTNPYYFD